MRGVVLERGGVELHSFRARSCAIASNRWRQRRFSCNLEHTLFCWRILWVAIVVSVVVKLLKSFSNAWLVHSFVVSHFVDHNKDLSDPLLVKYHQYNYLFSINLCMQSVLIMFSNLTMEYIYSTKYSNQLYHILPSAIK